MRSREPREDPQSPARSPSSSAPATRAGPSPCAN